MTIDAIREDEYSSRGDYHKELDPNWSYAPIYRRKLAMVDAFMEGNSGLTLDAGAGEGMMVERYRELGHNICGIDTAYQSQLVEKANLLELPHEDQHFDSVLCLDVLEHIDLLSQEPALNEIARVLKKDGRLLLTVPNLAHFHSRLRFAFGGQLTRTSAVERHPGDRPLREYQALLRSSGFTILRTRGIFPTLPIVFRLVNRHPARFGFLVPLLDRLLPFPGACFLSVIEAKRGV